jgi:hypothetical protein
MSLMSKPHKTNLKWYLVYWKSIVASLALLIISFFMFLAAGKWSDKHPLLCGQVLPAMASVLMTSGVFAVMYEIFLRRAQTEFVLEWIDVRESMIRSGLHGIYSDFDYDHGSLIKSASEVTVFALYARTWFGQHRHELSAHLSRKGHALILCVPALDNPFLEPLAKSFHYTPDELKKKISDAITEWALLEISQIGGILGTIQIYLHRARPSYSMFRFDDCLFIGTYDVGRARQPGPKFEFKKRPGGIFELYAREVEAVMANDAELIFDSGKKINRIEQILGTFVTEAYRHAVAARNPQPHLSNALDSPRPEQDNQ